MFRFVCKALISVGFVLAAFGAGSSANATNFGVSVDGANYSGTAVFNISQNCLNLGLPLGAFVFSGYNCGGSSSAMQFLSADVHFSGAQTGDVHFNAEANVILGMYVQNGVVTGVQSRTIGPATSDLPGNPAFDIFFGVADWASLDPFQTHAPVHDDGDSDLDDLSPDHFQQTHLVPLTSNVPEPGSLSLVVATLGAAALANRRRRGVSAG
jgi:hypothetical protein